MLLSLCTHQEITVLVENGFRLAIYDLLTLEQIIKRIQNDVPVYTIHNMQTHGLAKKRRLARCGRKDLELTYERNGSSVKTGTQSVG